MAWRRCPQRSTHSEGDEVRRRTRKNPDSLCPFRIDSRAAVIAVFSTGKEKRREKKTIQSLRLTENITQRVIPVNDCWTLHEQTFPLLRSSARVARTTERGGKQREKREFVGGGSRRKFEGQSPNWVHSAADESWLAIRVILRPRSRGFFVNFSSGPRRPSAGEFSPSPADVPARNVCI